jgi:hypothetical protein
METLACVKCGADVATISNPLAGLSRSQRAMISSAVTLLGADAGALLGGDFSGPEISAVLAVTCPSCAAAAPAA